MITRADIRAAREGLQKLAEGEENQPFSFYGTDKYDSDMMQIETEFEQLKNPEFIQDRAQTLMDSGMTRQEAFKSIRDDVGQLTMQYKNLYEKSGQGGLFDKQNAVTGGLGAVFGALIGGIFGGGKGAAIGGLLGGLALWAMQKFDMTPDFAKKFVRETADMLPGKANIPQAELESTINAVEKQIDENAPNVRTMGEEAAAQSPLSAHPNAPMTAAEAEAKFGTPPEKNYSTDADMPPLTEAERRAQEERGFRTGEDKRMMQLQDEQMDAAEIPDQGYDEPNWEQKLEEQSKWYDEYGDRIAAGEDPRSLPPMPYADEAVETPGTPTAPMPTAPQVQAQPTAPAPTQDRTGMSIEQETAADMDALGNQLTGDVEEDEMKRDFANFSAQLAAEERAKPKAAPTPEAPSAPAAPKPQLTPVQEWEQKYAPLIARGADPRSLPPRPQVPGGTPAGTGTPSIATTPAPKTTDPSERAAMLLRQAENFSPEKLQQQSELNKGRRAAEEFGQWNRPLTPEQRQFAENYSEAMNEPSPSSPFPKPTPQAPMTAHQKQVAEWERIYGPRIEAGEDPRALPPRPIQSKSPVPMPTTTDTRTPGQRFKERQDAKRKARGETGTPELLSGAQKILPKTRRPDEQPQPGTVVARR